MEFLNYLTTVWGISIVIISLALLVKEKHLKQLLASIEREESFFLWGFISLVIGIAMVLYYNVWAWNWQLVVTLLGWSAILKGIFLLFCTESLKKYTLKICNEKWLPIWLFILVLVGLVITYFGFTGV